VPIDRLGRWWTLLAANYLHGGLLHIFFNMMALRQLAPFIAREYGPARLVILYTVGGILGFWVSYLAGVRFTIGASAALCALIGAILFYGRSRGGVYGQAVFKQVGIWALVIFGLGLLLPNINNWGHGGGIVAGALLGWVLGYEEKRAETATHRTLAAICAAATVGVLVWAVVSAVYHHFFGLRLQ
jgi:rhomboid protease GluP